MKQDKYWGHRKRKKITEVKEKEQMTSMESKSPKPVNNHCEKKTRMTTSIKAKL